MKKEDILITSPSINTSENVSGIANLTRLLIEKNIYVNYHHFITGKKDMESHNFWWLTKQFTLFFRFFFRLAANFQIKICHFNVPQEDLAVLREAALIITAKLFGKKVIMHLRGGRYNSRNIDKRLTRIVFKTLILLSDRIICLSESEKTYLTHHYVIEPKKINVLPNAVVINQTLDKTYDKVLRILFLGRIDENKGFSEIVLVLKSLHTRINFKFLLCGTGPFEKFITKELGEAIPEEFTDCGVVAGERKNEVLRTAHIFLLPSYFEGLPNALLETMGFGVVPICTPVGSIPSVVKNGENGFLVPLHDSKAIETIILDLNSDRKKLEMIGNTAFQYIKNNHSLTNYIEGLNYIYDEMST
jgi:glycosyltransferase involved in cell wall biosynthesis